MKTTMTCPKCAYLSHREFEECPKCGVIVKKYFSHHDDSSSTSTPPKVRQEISFQLDQASSLIIKQLKELTEIITGFESPNKYEISNAAGHTVFRAEEEKGSFLTILTRFILKSMRPFTLNLYSDGGMRHFTIRRPFRFFFYEVQLEDENGQPMGSVRKRFNILRKLYAVYDTDEREIYELLGPFFRPWTFEIRENDISKGTITKKWGGILKEAFTDADTFGIKFPEKIDAKKKMILLSAVFLIDHAHFENSGN